MKGGKFGVTARRKKVKVFRKLRGVERVFSGHCLLAAVVEFSSRWRCVCCEHTGAGCVLRSRQHASSFHNVILTADMDSFDCKLTSES